MDTRMHTYIYTDLRAGPRARDHASCSMHVHALSGSSLIGCGIAKKIA